jgi:hypothetical protein
MDTSVTGLPANASPAEAPAMTVLHLRHPEGVALSLSTRGATWLACEVPLPDGARRAVILPHTEEGDAGAGSAFLGSTVGRYACPDHLAGAAPTRGTCATQHMASTLRELASHLSRPRGRPARIVVWAHNSHLGDARATEVAREGQLNLGQLAREQQAHAGDSFLLGFTTHTGTVAAARDWDAQVKLRRVRLSRPDSIEHLLHRAGPGRFVLPLTQASPGLRSGLARPRLQRAIGVIYRPDI